MNNFPYASVFTDATSYSPPLCEQDANSVIVAPISSDVSGNPENITNLMEVVGQHGQGFILFLCSNDAKKESIAIIAQQFPDLAWMAIESDFLHNPHVENFSTSNSLASYGSDDNSAQQRNLCLYLAKMLCWEYAIFVNDSLEITPSLLRKVNSLLQDDNTQVVSVGHAPLSEPAMLGVKTKAPLLAFFPHTNASAPLFAIGQSLISNNSVVWSEAKTSPSEPLSDVDALLTNGLSSLVLQTKQSYGEIDSLQGWAQKITDGANEMFWENEINKQISKTAAILDNLNAKKVKKLYRHHEYTAAKRSLSFLAGDATRYGVRAAELAAWTKAWCDDLLNWSDQQYEIPRASNICEAAKTLGYNNTLFNDRETSTSGSPKRQRSSTLEEIPKLRPILPQPITQRSSKTESDLLATLVLSDHLKDRGQGIDRVKKSAAKLRFDRPSLSISDIKPRLSVCMFVSGRESPEPVRQTALQIIEWAKDSAPLQLVVWVCNDNNMTNSELERKRSDIVANLLLVLRSTNVWLRSGTVPDASNTDDAISSAMVDLAFAYWKCNIPIDHPVFVINSRGAGLQWGALWQFVAREPRVPVVPLEAFVKKHLPKAPERSRIIPLEERDQNIIYSTRQELSRPAATLKFGDRCTAKLLRSMKRAQLDWFKIDEIAHQFVFHHPLAEHSIDGVRNIEILLCKYKDNLPEDANRVKNQLSTMLASSKRAPNPTEILVVVHSSNNTSWSRLDESRHELMRNLLDACKDQKNLVFTSLTCSCDSVDAAKKQALAVENYRHWIEDDTITTKARFHQLS